MMLQDGQATDRGLTLCSLGVKEVVDADVDVLGRSDC